MQSITFIINGIHGESSFIKQIIQALKNNSSISYSLHLTQKPGHAKELAFQACESNCTLIVAAGGDGTVNEVVNGMMQSTKAKPILSILPIGTGNDFMRFRKQFQSVESFFQSLKALSSISLDIGFIESTSNNQYFLNIADIGFGASTVHTLNRQRKFLRGKISYSIAILRTFFGFKKPTLKITGSSFQHKGKIMLIAFCNGKSFGNGIIVAPTALPDDGKMNITIFGNLSILDYLKYLPKLKKGELIQHKEVRYEVDNDLKIEIIQGKADTEADGETVTSASIHVKLMPNQIRLLEPLGD